MNRRENSTVPHGGSTVFCFGGTVGTHNFNKSNDKIYFENIFSSGLLVHQHDICQSHLGLPAFSIFFMPLFMSESSFAKML